MARRKSKAKKSTYNADNLSNDNPNAVASHHKFDYSVLFHLVSAYLGIYYF